MAKFCKLVLLTLCGTAIATSESGDHKDSGEYSSQSLMERISIYQSSIKRWDTQVFNFGWFLNRIQFSYNGTWHLECRSSTGYYKTTCWRASNKKSTSRMSKDPLPNGLWWCRRSIRKRVLLQNATKGTSRYNYKMAHSPSNRMCILTFQCIFRNLTRACVHINTNRPSQGNVRKGNSETLMCASIIRIWGIVRKIFVRKLYQLSC